MDYPLSVKLDFFTVEPSKVEKNCIDCGAWFEIDSRLDWNAKRCASCTILHRIDLSRQYTKKQACEVVTGYIAVDLAAAVITKAIIDARNGDAEAREFLRAEDGAVLYLKYAGVEVDAEMRRRLFWIGKKRNAETMRRMNAR